MSDDTTTRTEWAPDLVSAAAPLASADTPAAGIPTADRGLGVPPPGEPVALRGESPVKRLDNLFHDMLGGTALGNHTDLWNLVHAFKERAKALLTEAEKAA